MATYEELAMDWSCLQFQDSECWECDDLQLAAELGKTLLERNKELESSLRQHQAIIEDQAQEIEYLNKQTVALREVNDSRLRIYEQLEVSISELENHNKNLLEENTNFKKKTKGLLQTIDSLESRCEEQQKLLEEFREREREWKVQKSREDSCTGILVTIEENNEIAPRSVGIEELQTRLLEEVHDLQEQLSDMNVVRERELKQREELEMELACILQENSLLHNQISGIHKSTAFTSNIEEEIRLINNNETFTCNICLRQCSQVEDSLQDVEEVVVSPGQELQLKSLSSGPDFWSSTEFSSPVLNLHDDHERSSTDYGDSSEAGESVQNVSLLAELDNQYQVLIDKYEALLEARNNSVERVMSKPDFSCVTSLKTPKTSFSHVNEDSIEGESGAKLLLTDLSNLSSTGTQTKLCPSTESVNILEVKNMRRNKLDSFSEDGSSSSGFSEREVKLVTREVQTETEDLWLNDMDGIHGITEDSFQSTPKYRQLFEEIYRVINSSKPNNDRLVTCEVSHIANTTETAREKDTSCLTDELKQRPQSVNHSSGDSACCSDEEQLSQHENSPMRIHRKLPLTSDNTKPPRTPRLPKDCSKGNKKFRATSDVTIPEIPTRSSRSGRDYSRQSETGLTFSVSAEVARLRQLEKSYAEALRTGLKSNSRLCT